jgi:hypothetical protein
MDHRRHRALTVAIALLVGAAWPGTTMVVAGVPIVKAVPWRITGEAICTGSDLSVNAIVNAGGSSVTGLTVTAQGQAMKELSPGLYRLALAPHACVTGSAMTVVFQDARVRVPADASLPLRAQATVGPPITLVRPVHGAHIPYEPKGVLTIEWTGGTPPCAVGISRAGSVVLEMGSSTTQATVPMSRLGATGEYFVFLDCLDANFRFNRPVDAGTHYHLDHYVGASFWLDAVPMIPARR